MGGSRGVEVRAPEESELARQAKSSVVWAASQQWVLRASGLVSVAILARLLTPADFGVVALASALLPFIQTLCDMGFSTYLVQAQHPTSRTFSTVFWYSALTGVVLGLLLVVTAPFAATILGTPEVVPVLRALSLVAVLSALASVPIAVLRRAIDFRRLALQSVAAGFVGQVIAVALALTGAGVWALVTQAVVYQLVGTVLAWVAARWRLTAEFSWTEFRTMVRFGVKVLATDMVSVGRLWVENAIVVAALGTTGLGYLNIAQRLIQIAHELTASAVSSVSVVVFARIRDAAGRLLAAYLRAQYMAHVLVVPILVLIAVAAPLLLPLAFGAQWGPSVLPCQILAVAGILTMSGIDRGLLVGMGRPGRYLLFVGGVDALTVSVAWFTARHGLAAFALGFLGVALVATLSRWLLVARELGTSVWNVGQPLLRSAGPAAAGAAAGLVLTRVLHGLPAALELGVVGLVVVGVYVALVRLALPGPWHEIVEFGLGAVRRLRSRRVVRA